MQTTIDLLDAVPRDVEVVSESGIGTPEDVRRLRQAGVGAFLVGTSFMREADPGTALQRLFAPLPEREAGLAAEAAASATAAS